MERKVTRYEVEDGVALITLDRPDRLNAWTARMAVEYQAGLEEAEADAAVRVVVVTGAGRGFCAGADTKGLSSMADDGRYDSGARGDQRPFVQHYPLSMSKPVIAAVNGPAAGVGFVVMCFADIRFAAAGAKLTTSFARLGLPAEHGVSWILPRIVGVARAADLLLSSRVVLADEALELGLVNRVLPADELLPETLGYARRIASETAPFSIATMKRQLYADLASGLQVASRSAIELMNAMVEGPEFAEGVAALTQKRQPRFS